MRIIASNIDEFIAEHSSVLICTSTQMLKRSTHFFNILANNSTVQKRIIETIDDMQYLDECFLPWYKPNARGEKDWNFEGCTNYSVGEYVDLVLKKQIERQDIQDLVKSLSQKGLNKNIVITVASDTILNKKLIIDGCKRTIALNLLDEDTWKSVTNLGASSFKIGALELTSKLTHFVYPADFMKLALING